MPSAMGMPLPFSLIYSHNLLSKTPVSVQLFPLFSYGLMFLYENYGDLYYKLKNKKAALKSYEESLKIAENLDNKKMIKVIEIKISMLKKNGHKNEKK